MRQELIIGVNIISGEYAHKNPWTPVYGLARSILALGTFLTLLFNKNEVLFANLSSTIGDGSIFVRQFNLFLLFGERYVNLSVWISVVLLFLVVIGWRPRITCIFHWWVASSFIHTSGLVDGGDQIASIISLFLIPVCLTDNRKWHWDSTENKNKSPYLVLFIWSVIFIIRLQVAFIYFNAGVDKLRIDEWKDGTSAYYWFTNDIYGASDMIRNAVFYFTSNGLIVTLLTYGTLVIEIILGMAFFMRRNSVNWKILLIIGVAFHLGIILIFGLVSFFMTMTAALLLYLVPLDYFYQRKIKKPRLAHHNNPYYDGLPTIKEPLILFDGECNLCTSTVQFIIKRDPRNVFRFASLQSELGQRILFISGLPQTDFKTFIFYHDTRIYEKSSAVLKISAYLCGFWPLLSLFRIIPIFLRDHIYDIIANNRKNWHNKNQTCWLPSEELKKLFLN